jgi:hypothetical protein
MMAFDPNGQYLVLFGGYGNGFDGGPTYFFNDTWALGPNLTVFARAIPRVGDVGVSVNLSAVVTPAASGLTYSYSGTPPGCPSKNASYIICKPTAPGLYNFSVTAADPAGDSDTSYAGLNISPTPSVVSISITPRAVDVGVLAYLNATTLPGSGGDSYAWTGLPGGCASANTTNLTCRPTQNGTFAVELIETDIGGGQGRLSDNFTVNALPKVALVVAKPSVFDVAQPAEMQATVTGGTAPLRYTWTNLPSGCAAADEPVISCRPLTLGVQTINVSVVDAVGKTAKGGVVIIVNPALKLTGSGLSPATTDQGIKVTFFLNVTGGSEPYNYTFLGAPAGCVLANSPAPSCTPSESGTFEVTLLATDQAEVNVSDTVTLTVDPDPEIAPGSFSVSPNATDIGSGNPIAFTTAVQNGSGIYTYAYTGLPGGCAASAQASFSCTPTETGTFKVSVTATDTWERRASASLSLTIGAKFGVALSANVSTVTVGGAVSFRSTVSGGLAPYAYTYSGLPPACPKADASTISCHPSTAGTYQIEVLAVDDAHVAASSTITFNVTAPAPASSGIGTTVLLGVGLVVVLVVVAVVVLMMRRRRPAASRPAAPPAPRPKTSAAPEAEPEEELYGAGPPSAP